jgi:hypothetical protein
MNDMNRNSGNSSKSEFVLLVYAHLGKTLDSKGATALRQYLQDAYYVARFVEICKQDRLIYELFSTGLPRAMPEPDVMDFAMLQEMAKYEEYAPSLKIETPVPQPQQELIQCVQRERIKYNLNRSSILTLVASAAAVALIFIFAYFMPSGTGIKVAVMEDSIHAKWADIDGTMERGTSILPGRKTLTLKEGCAKLVLDNNAQVTIEGPASFRILSGDQIELGYGKLYAIVPHEAIGFSVYTENAKIIDLGTEFGVQVDINGGTYLYVMRGSTKLVTGTKTLQEGIEVNKGIAKKIAYRSSEISDITFRDELFVRNIDSQNQIVWKGRSYLDLADMVRNGNGLGTGNSSIRLDPFKGFTYDQHFVCSVAENKYLVIKNHPFIDGVFIPDGETVVSSRGDVFKNCPITGGVYVNDLLASPTPGIFGGRTVSFNGQEYSDRGKSCIVMHGNHGITFDLEAMRQTYHRSINRFATRIGIADFKEKQFSNANIYVLVDGRVCYSLLQYKQMGILNDASIEITDKDRFLTLIATDGDGVNKSGEDMASLTFTYDWCIFTEPVLMLE